MNSGSNFLVKSYFLNKVKNIILIFLLFSCTFSGKKKEAPNNPRIIISTDIGGTDPDDNQSMIHFLMYSNLFDIEGIISSPSYGDGTTQDILEMISLYEKDLPKLKNHAKDYPSPDSLRLLCKQGRKSLAPYAGYSTSTEGSDWIVKCAKKKSNQPLWILVWGGLEDLAQALHDAPEIQNSLRIYWIGGPNKKWSTNSYGYIAENFPNLWFIEANAAYRGFFSNNGSIDSLRNENYYKNFIKGTGHLGKSFKKYYDGNIKMGDTPSLLYLMNGFPNDPQSDSWGGKFEKINSSPRVVFNRSTSISDTVPVYSIVEFHLEGPKMNIPADSSCFSMTVQAGIGKQIWPGYYLGDNKYAIRYAPKKAETLSYEINSNLPGFPEQSGELVVENTWPGKANQKDFKLGTNWYTDSTDPNLFDNGWQGAHTILKWRKDILLDWAERWAWLYEE